jgi:hypothetical protein
MSTERNAMHIRNVPPELRRRVKAQAAGMGLTLAEWLGRAAESIQREPSGPLPDLGCEIVNAIPKKMHVALAEHITGETWATLCDEGREASVIGDWLAELSRNTHKGKE